MNASSPTFLRAFVAGMLAAAPTACGDEPGCDEPLRICDIGSSECREHVFVQTACARGFDDHTPPPVESITRAELIEVLRPDETPTQAQALEDEQRAKMMRMLRLVPPSTTSDMEASIQTLASQVLAFYDRDSGTVTLVESNLGDIERSAEIFVLSHEFVHAQQDVDIGLQGFFDEHVTTYDSATASRCVTEGEAVHYSNLTLARQPGAEISAEAFAAYYRDQQGAVRQLAADREAVGYTELTLAFPYPFGGELVTEEWFAAGDPGVLALYDAPWPSTGDVLRLLGDEPPRGAPDVPSLAAPDLPEGWSILADDTFGAWITFAFAHRNLVARSTAEEIALDWSGDRLLVAVGPTASDVALAWRFRFGDERSAESLAVVGDVPPHEGAWSVVRDGRDLMIVVGPDADSLPTWEASFVAAAPGRPEHEQQPRPQARAPAQGGAEHRLPLVERDHPGAMAP